MMNYVYARRDISADRFMPPFVAGNDQLACRSYCFLYDAFNDPCLDSYRLYRIGYFNDETGCLEASDPVDISDTLDTFIDDFVEATVVQVIKEKAGVSE